MNVKIPIILSIVFCLSACNVSKKMTKERRDVIDIKTDSVVFNGSDTMLESNFSRFLNENVEKTLHRRIVIYDTDKEADENGIYPIKAVIEEDEKENVNRQEDDSLRVIEQCKDSSLVGVVVNKKESVFESDTMKEERKSKFSGGVISFSVFILVLVLSSIFFKITFKK